MASQLAYHCDSSLAHRLSCWIWSQSPSYKPHYRLTFKELLSLLLPSAKSLFNQLFVLSAIRFRQWCNAKVPNWEKYSTTVGATGRLHLRGGRAGWVFMLGLPAGMRLDKCFRWRHARCRSLYAISNHGFSGQMLPFMHFFFCLFLFIPPHSSLSSFSFLHWLFLCW